jgi:hypothetical protein
MKRMILSVLTIISVITSCKKTEDTPPDAGAINVTNAVVGGSTITLLTEINVISAGNTVSPNSYTFMPVGGGQVNIFLGVPAVAATAISPAAPAVAYYSQVLPVDGQTNYSLFLTGPSPVAVESVLINEKYPRSYADSVCGVRFINLAQGNTPISVNIRNSPNGSEATSIAYKAYTDFKQYPAKKVNPSYIFEFRNASTGVLITSYTLNTPYFHNVTLVLRGIIGGTTGVILDNNY